MFRGLLIDKQDGRQTVSVQMLDEASLPEGEVTVRVACSTLNYKDALAITGSAQIQPSRTYTLDECYRMSRALYIGYETALPRYLAYYDQYSPAQQATLMDFVHHFGWGRLSTSTMRRLANAGIGGIDAACEEHLRWRFTTLPSGVTVEVEGLKNRAEANEKICTWRAPAESDD